HRAGLFVHEVLDALRNAVKPGISTMDLEKLAEEKIAGRPGKAAFKGYRGYPCVLCTSVNSESVHGIPSPKRKLREGDIVSIDFGMEVDGYYADSAVTVPVGRISPEMQKLLDVTREALDRAIDKMRAGNRLGDVGHAVQSWVEKHGFSVVREFVVHLRADAVPDKLPPHRETVLFDPNLYRVTDIAKTITGAPLINRAVQRFAGHLQQLLHLRPNPAERNRHRRVRVVAVHFHAEIERDDVAFAQFALGRGNPVNNLAVHRSAQHAGIPAVALECR